MNTKNQATAPEVEVETSFFVRLTIISARADVEKIYTITATSKGEAITKAVAKAAAHSTVNKLGNHYISGDGLYLYRIKTTQQINDTQIAELLNLGI